MAEEANQQDQDPENLLISKLSFPGAQPAEDSTTIIGDEFKRADLDFGKIDNPQESDDVADEDVVNTGWSLPKIDIPAAAGNAPAVSAGVATSAVPAGVEATVSTEAAANPETAGPSETATNSTVPDFMDVVMGSDPYGDEALGSSGTPGTAAGSTESFPAESAGPENPDIFETSVMAPLKTPDRQTSAPKNAPKSKDSKKKRLIAIIVAVVVVIAVAAAAIGITLVRRNSAARTHASALLECTTSVKNYSAAKTALEKATTDSESAQQISADQLTDASTLQKLQQALSAAPSTQTAKTCSGLMTDSALNAATAANTKLTKAAKSSATAVTNAAQAVTASAQSQEVGAAKTALQAKLTSAQARYEQTAGVSSEETRAALKTALDTAQSLIDSPTATVDAINAASSEIDTTLAAVNTSANASETTANSTDGDATGTGTGTGTRRRNYTYVPPTTGGTTPTPDTTTSTPDSTTTTPETETTPPSNETKEPTVPDDSTSTEQ